VSHGAAIPFFPAIALEPRDASIRLCAALGVTAQGAVIDNEPFEGAASW